MSLFPFMTRGIDTNTVKSIEIYKEYEYSFRDGKLTGKILGGKEALKMWIYKALMTMRYIYPIYSWDYGQDLDELIGQGYNHDLIESEVQRRVQDCLLINDKIRGCHSFEINFINDELQINFTVDTSGN